jgi:hypothetical protein
MTRTAVARLFLVSVSSVGVGIELLFVAGILGAFSPSSPTGSIMPTPLAYGMATFAAIGAGLVAGGVLGQLVAAFAALVAYLIEAPDEGRVTNRRCKSPIAMHHGVSRAG